MDISADNQGTVRRSHSASDALGLWEPKRTLTLAAARKHTLRIRAIRHALIGISAALAVILIYFFATQSSGAQFEDDPDTSVKMVNPRYSGRTADGLPFYLTSDTATRELETRNEIALVAPVLEFIRADGAESSYIEAEVGEYDDVAKVLDLREDVVLETDDGYRCTTTHARIYAQEKRIEGDEPIQCTGNFGEVSGTRYEVIDEYRTFVFKDGMTSRIERDPASARVSAVDDETAPTPERRRAFGFAGNGPIAVSATRAVYNEGTTDLEGDVMVVQDGATVFSDEMIILRDKAENRAAGSIKLGAIREITGTGNFRYVSDTNDVRGDQGVYKRAEEQIIVTGDVSVMQEGGNTVSTDRLTYDTESETIQFSGQCQGRDCGLQGRTRVTIKQ